MTIQSNIKLARDLQSNPMAYARVMSGFIRSAMSDKAVSAYRVAVMQDGLVDYFDDWSTDCPIANVRSASWDNVK